MSESEPDYAETFDAPPMPVDQTKSVGENLRQARERQNFTLEDVANSLCIRVGHVRAIENGQYKSLPGLVYARGFVRSYAEYLKLNCEEILTLFRAETVGHETPKDTIYVPSNNNRQLPSKRTIVVSLLGFAGLLILWSMISTPSSDLQSAPDREIAVGVDIPSEDGTEISNTNANSENIYSRDDANAEPQRAYVTANAENQQNADAAVATMDTESTNAATTEKPPSKIEETSAPAQNLSTDQYQKPLSTDGNNVQKPTVVTPPPSGIAFEALADAWIQVKDSDGNSIFSKVLRTGDVYNVPASFTDATLTTGNAGGLAARVNGKRVGVLGKPGEVVHNIAIDGKKLTSMAREIPR